MLPKFYRNYAGGICPRIMKTVSGEDASNLGAFSFDRNAEIIWDIFAPRKLGHAAVVLRYHRDGEKETDLPFSFCEISGNEDHYRLVLSMRTLLPTGDSGLIYYSFLFVRGADTLFTNSINNVNFALTDHPANDFRLLLTSPDFHTPQWFVGATMYHIFVDRFCRGNGEITRRPGTELDEDWEHGIPQYALYPGAPLPNNRFFGGNLWGIIEKLDYLCSLGVNVLYLSPIFEAASNHKYDTSDYEKIDTMFGGEQAFSRLLEETKKRGMHIILDGVFNHTGDDSRYFNRYGTYESIGAYQSQSSPYASWYTFRSFPDDYECWWGIPILPRLRSDTTPVREYLAGHAGIAATRIRQGVAGWRLDVADELSDEFLDTLRQSVHDAAVSDQPILIGEVWENAADKMAYGKRRRYFGGKQLDSVMNYPLREGILSFVRDADANALYHTLTELYSSYPRQVCDCLMNFLGTHDTERILTLLGDAHAGEGLTNEQLSTAHLDKQTRARAIKALQCAFVILFTVFGVPSVYYGDEAGMEGYHDPFCRFPYPWGHEDTSLIQTVRFLGTLRKGNDCFHGGDFRILSHSAHALVYERRRGHNAIITAVNRGKDHFNFTLFGRWECIYSSDNGRDTHTLYRKVLMLSPGETILLREI